ncbi:xanthine dehydrogenase family protein molybdopterin-binding subunit [Spirosoma pollinicola]|uniref:Acylaldehyde oxidase n=1 Tax=Spirosoma pollinicola TaxID=2057025 RepID=A0A2K8Z9Q3_9BACT|nr:xanthine dehydrogenase family protein molybdopterin-binding subunit [Spirosoma pollinicola]AUD06606.1 acylaldehyde oxidase [Spirosoma pollinicola]
MTEIGKPLSRIEGKLKISGMAQYAAEFNQPNMAYAFAVQATIAKGTITKIDTTAALKSAGVITVLTHQNMARLKKFEPMDLFKSGGSLSEFLLPLQDNKIEYYGQIIGMVVAETYEQARSAARLVQIRYSRQTPVTDLKKAAATAVLPKMTGEGGPAQLNEGKAAAPLASSPHRIEATYTTSIENHHPMETHATIAVWEGSDRLTVYHGTQGILFTQKTLSFIFDLKPENVRVLSPYLGGGFGCKLGWPELLFAVMSARAVQRPVKFVTTRQMMQTTVGRRASTIQKVALGTDTGGRLTVIRHQVTTFNNLTQVFEASASPSKVLYKAPAIEATNAITKLNIGAPTQMRGPGFSSGSFAIESAMDEMAYKLGMDPIQFRILNYTATDQVEKLPFSAKYLLDCYRIGAEAFGWNRRKLQPRQNRQGNYFVGYGMASAIYPAHRSVATAKVRLTQDGKLKVMSATQDIGTGTYTIIAQTAADTLRIPVESINVEIGDSNLPPCPPAAGSQTVASVMPAVMAAAEQVRNELMQLAINDSKSALHGKSVEAIGFGGGTFFLKDDPGVADSFTTILRRANRDAIEACVGTKPIGDMGLGPKSPPCMITNFSADANDDDKKYSFYSFGAQFAEVWIDEDFGTIKVKRFTSVQDVGRIMNEKTARSQVMGSVIYHIGQALMEETLFDNRFGNPVTRSLADYHVPVQLDIPDIDVHFINKPDLHVSPIGARGVGEIGGVGVASAIANAAFNAVGKRVRSLPMTLDKLL